MVKYPFRGILNLLLLIILVISVYVVTVLDDSSQKKFGLTIDIMGRQGMLIQRIANISNQLRICELRPCNSPVMTRLDNQLHEAGDMFRNSSSDLSSGRQNHLPLVKLDQRIYDDAGVDRQKFNRNIALFLRLVDDITTADPSIRVGAAGRFDSISELLMPEIDALVATYIEKADNAADHMAKIQYLILLLLAVAIPINGIMIFRPLDKSLRKSNAELVKQKDFIQNIIGFMPDPLLIINADGQIIVANKAAEKLFGWSEKNLLGMNISRLFDPDASPEYSKAIRNFITNSEKDSFNGVIKSRIVEGVNSTGENIKISVSLARHTSDSRLGIIIIRDMSLSENLNKALEDYLAKVRIAKESKNRFIRNISHELRTPLNAVIGFSDLLKINLGKPDNLEYANNINVAGLALLEKINQLIKVSEVHAEKRKISPSRVDLASYITKMKDIWQEQLQEKNHNLIIDEIPENLMVNIDKDIFSYIVRSILDNVVVHCAEGRNVKIYPDRNKKKPCLIIADNGHGVSEDHLPRLGSPFEKKGEGLTAEKGGLSLSLFLAVQQMRTIGGNILFHSIAGEGFAVRLCLQGADAGEETADNII